MGSMITLGINHLEIDWGKNNRFFDHSPLFQLNDVKSIPHYYIDLDTEKLIVEMKEGFSKNLASIKKRLNLLGYTLENIASAFEEELAEANYHGIKLDLSFGDFYKAIYYLDLNEIDLRKDSQGYVDFQEGANGYDFGEYARKCILNDPEILLKLLNSDVKSLKCYNWRFLDDLSSFLENLSPYIVLRIIAENPLNHSFELQWRYYDIVENGWVKKEEILKPLSQKHKILIVTEGSTDSHIIQESIKELFPDIADFFNFIDMKANYPFTGVGSLYNFCMGLAKINIENNVLVLIDNDTAGCEIYELILRLTKPSNLHICKLPEHVDFTNIRTIGPDGESFGDVNGRAVAIECFLDFNSVNKPIYIRWTSYNSKRNAYQGEIYPKNDLYKTFCKSNLKSGNYDVSKLIYLIDFLIEDWTRNQKHCNILI